MSIDALSWFALVLTVASAVGAFVAHVVVARRERRTNWSRAMRVLGETIERGPRA